MLIVHLDGVQPLDKTWGSKLLLKHETCYQYKCSVTKDLLCTVISMKSSFYALKSPQKFLTPGCSSANFLGSLDISGLKLKSYYEILTFWIRNQHCLIVWCLDLDENRTLCIRDLKKPETF